ncbi:protease [Ferrigenium kumadai]|uniref:Protease n=1 Tax=Ferrigenium kumadai TaxID=1682490 RepID=A0AAN1T0A1_9PROT|nr:U32 family peptidase [Ferrigenium kumadai]BBJ00334.1 protease [Ferrigenium kumadai]
MSEYLSSQALELLAPAKNTDIAREAILHGADAVYIGGPSFGARDKAGNSLADIAALVEFAHRFRAKIFVTLNTILHDAELEAARKLAHDCYDAGVDALIVQDMGLLELDLPPIALHASTQCDIRTPEKARFLADVGFSQIVLARELTISEIARVHAAVPADTVIEHFIHGALCVAYSGQCYISHAHTGRSANRGDCSQACRLPYTLTDGQGRVVAYDKHLLSVKDNNQSDNLRALIAAGVRSFKIEGRYKDAPYVKNITGHYRQLLDGILEERTDLHAASSGKTKLLFTPDPDKTFHRGATDYFSNGRKSDIGAFDTPTFAGTLIGQVSKIGPDWFEIETDETLANGDGLNYLHKRETHGIRANSVRQVETARGMAKAWRIWPNEKMFELAGLRIGLDINRNSDHAWEQALAKKSAERKIGISAAFAETADGFSLTLRDEDSITATSAIAFDKQPAQHPAEAEGSVREQLSRFGNTDFELRDVGAGPAAKGSLRSSGAPAGVPLAGARDTKNDRGQGPLLQPDDESSAITIHWDQPWFVPSSALNKLRRDAVERLEAARLAAYVRPLSKTAIEPPAKYPEESLSYLANVYNSAAQAFYARHGVKLVEAAYEQHQEAGEVSLMITRHCIRYSLSLCPKQAKGVTGVQGTVRAEPMTLVNGSEKLRLEFDCKACEMHVMGKMKKHILKTPPPTAVPVTFHPRHSQK